MERYCVRCERVLQEPLSEYNDYVAGPLSVSTDVVEKVQVKNGDIILHTVRPHELPKALEQTLVLLEDLEGITTQQIYEPTEVQKTHLICVECLDSSDYIIWGVDKGVRNTDVLLP